MFVTFSTAIDCPLDASFICLCDSQWEPFGFVVMKLFYPDDDFDKSKTFWFFNFLTKNFSLVK